MVCIRPLPQPPNISRPQPPVKPGPAPRFTFEAQKEVTKYEYLYGIRDLRITGEEYKPKSVYVSKPIEVPGNVVEVSLNAKETHPLFGELSKEAAARQTSVEYYIAYEENPGLEDWHPILPEDQKEVLGELLLFDTASTANLRFVAIPEKEGLQQARVYKDQILLPPDKWSFANGGRQIVLLEEYSPSSIYTIDYVPNAEVKNPWVVNIAQHQLRKVRQVDVFPEGTNRNKTVILSQYPYINYEVINQDSSYNPNTSAYQPIKVRLKNANIAGPDRTVIKEVLPYNPNIQQDAYTYNVTDYKTGAWKALRPYSLKSEDRYKGFEYIHDGRKLYFSETFNKADINENLETNHGNAEIEVEYEYVVSSFRIKIILRRNGPGVTSVTPVVHSYALKFKTMR